VLRSTCKDAGQTVERSENTRYYHVRVSNARRWWPANNVQVLVLQVEESVAGANMQVVWTGAVPLGWRYQEYYPAARTVGAPADVDLCSVGEGKWLQIHPLFVPFNLKVRREHPCTLVLSLQAQGREADSPSIRVKITWDGQWHDEAQEMRQHLLLEVLGDTAS